METEVILISLLKMGTIGPEKMEYEIIIRKLKYSVYYGYIYFKTSMIIRFRLIEYYFSFLSTYYPPIVVWLMTENVQFSFIDESRFSKWSRLIRTAIWVLKFLKLTMKDKIEWRKPMTTMGKGRQPEEIKLAEWALIKQAQNDGINE